MNIRFHNGLICTMENGDMTPVWGDLWVKDNRVHHVGPPKKSDFAFEREIDLNGNLVIPGFKNAHTHSAMTFLRSFADDLPLLDWLDKQVFPMEAKLQQEDIYDLTRLAIMEYLSSGITANFDMYMWPMESAYAAVDTGFRSVFCGTLHNFIGSLEELEENYQALNQFDELVSAQLSFHAEYTCSAELLRGVADVVQRLNAPLFMHSSETAREVEQCLERTGQTPTAWMDSLGLFENGGGAFHCVHMTPEDLDIMKKKNMAVVSCPGSNTKLASGIAPLRRMLEMGIPVALGTDGPASNNCLDMFREMFLATGLQKLVSADAAAVPAEEVLRMACRTGAQVMGLTDCDSLAVGKLADLVVIDMMQPNMQPMNAPLNNLVYSGSKRNVKMTVVNGDILYEDGQFSIHEDPVYIYKRANDIITRMMRP